MSEASFKRYEEQERRLREQLEIVIHHLVKGERGDRVIETLYSYFESTSAILGATPYYLERSGLNHANALLLSMVPAITRYMIRQTFGEHPRLKTLSATGEFVRKCYTGMRIERFTLLCFDKHGRLQADRCLREGNEESAPFYPREIFFEAIKYNAHAIVLCHNHPGGKVKPSRADIECTMCLLETAKILDVILLDHIIVSGRKICSFRDAGFLRPSMLPPAHRADKLFNTWLDISYLD